MKKILTIIAAIMVLGLILFGIMRWLGEEEAEQPSPETSTDETSELAQPEWCAAVEVISAPGTWESFAEDDPYNPQAVETAMLENVTRPLQERYPDGDVAVWTLPYTAQFRNINALGEMTYDDSKAEGIAKVREELRAVHAECPQTKFILMGFSQGAVIAGDVAAMIGLGNDPIPADQVVGVALLADGRRTAEAGQFVGNPVAGVGAEVALQPVNALIQTVVPGATMTGARENGFGALEDRTFEICAPDDNICDSPTNVVDGVLRAQDLIAANGVHAMYATNPNVIPGTTATQWMVDWAAELIDANR